MIVDSHQVIKDILKKFEIEEFDPTGTEYNPNLQESLLQIPTPPGCKHNDVAMVMRTGYTIKGRLLRSARVGVFNWFVDIMYINNSYDSLINLFILNIF